MKKRLLKRSFVLLLVMILSLGKMMDTYTNQVNETASTVTEEKNVIKQGPEVIRELKEFRTANSTTYLLSDGSRKLEINSSNIRYEKNGELINYNPDLKKMGEKDSDVLRKLTKKADILSENEVGDYQYVNIEGNAKHYFPEKLNEDTGIFMKKDKYAIEFTPVIENEKNIMQNTKTSREKEGIVLDAQEEDIKKNEIIYKGKEENIQYKYTSYPTYVKEEIILKKAQKSNVFEFVFNLYGMRLETVGPDNSIQIRDKNTNAVVAYVDSPNIKDKNGELRYDVVGYEIEEQENEIYLLKVVVDEDYLKSTETEYPVTIDPTVVWMDSHLESATVSSFSGNSSMNLKNGASFEVQYCGINRVPMNNTEFRCYVDTMVNPLSGDIGEFNGSYVQSAGLKIVEYSDLPNNTGTIEIRTPEGRWNPDTITWNNCPKMGTRVWAQFQTKGTKGAGHRVDLTEWAQALADGEINNYGLILKAKEKGTRAYFYGSSLSNLNYMQLSIVYWPYKCVVNNYYDQAFNIRYKTCGSAITKINETNIAINKIFEEVLGLYTVNNTPTMITSLADNCKLRRGIGINSGTIDQKCPKEANHNPVCTEKYNLYRDFIAKYPGNKSTASVLWIGNRLYNSDGEEDNRSFKWYNYGVNLEELWEPNEYYTMMASCLAHEMSHIHGAPDHYHEIISNEPLICRGGALCKTCNPETGRDESCLMNVGWMSDIATRDKAKIHCKECIQDMKNYLEENK
ncbi:MAG: DNRLRE domain-containing protein [Eubacterium sp.]|nr:DNRLRE domain-containing protein [Eubacterium sp.]